MDLEAWTREVDVETPSSARMYDYFLGGLHNFAADRAAADRVIAAMPIVPLIAKANRAFLTRAVRYLLSQGVRQFLDVGAGIPTVGNVHEVAQQIAPGSRVVYADIDPIAITMARRLLAENERATAILGDLRRPEELLDNPELRQVLDLSQPVGLLLVSVLHFMPDTDNPQRAIASLREALAPGSHLAITHGLDVGFVAGQAEAVQGVYRKTTTPGGGLRSRDGIAAFFAGFELVDPGLVWLPTWRPDAEDGPEEQPSRFGFLAGVGKKNYRA